MAPRQKLKLGLAKVKAVSCRRLYQRGVGSVSFHLLTVVMESAGNVPSAQPLKTIDSTTAKSYDCVLPVRPDMRIQFPQLSDKKERD